MQKGWLELSGHPILYSNDMLLDNLFYITIVNDLS